MKTKLLLIISMFIIAACSETSLESQCDKQRQTLISQINKMFSELEDFQFVLSKTSWLNNKPEIEFSLLSQKEELKQTLIEMNQKLSPEEYKLCIDYVKNVSSNLNLKSTYNIKMLNSIKYINKNASLISKDNCKSEESCDSTLNNKLIEIMKTTNSHKPD